jgi:hypothetical protein
MRLLSWQNNLKYLSTAKFLNVCLITVINTKLFHTRNPTGAKLYYLVGYALPTNNRLGGKVRH